MVFLVSVHVQRYVGCLFFHASSLKNRKTGMTLVNHGWANITGDLMPVKHLKENADVLFVGATPTSSQVTLQLVTQLARGCKHFLPNKQPAESALASLPFPPRGGTGPQQRTLRSSVPATRLRYLCPPLPAIQLPSQQPG